MASDREVMQLIDDVKQGKLPKPHEESLVESVVAEAMAPSLAESMTFLYNPDGTLNTVKQSDSTLKFVWNSDGSLHRVNKYKRS